MEKDIEPIIQQYCGPIEERIAACHDKKVARLLRQFLFDEIRQHCKNKATLAAVRAHIDSLIQQRFQSKPK